MNKIKKGFLTIGALGAALAPLGAVVACGAGDADKYTPLTPEQFKKVVAVSDGGSFTDKSFNQQSAEALEDILGKKPAQNQLLAASGHDAAAITNQYKTASNGGNKVVLAPGFYHDAAVQKWNKDVGVNELSFIVADSGITKTDNVAAIVYRTKQSSFIAGYMAAMQLTKDDSTTTPSHKIGTWGGGNFPGVTDFMVGFIEGIKYFNENKPTDHDRGTIKFYQFGTDKAWVDSTFKPGAGTTKASAMVADGVKMIFPVAGPQIADAITAASSGSGVKVIGVDADQKIAQAGKKSYVFTSVLKDVKNSMIDVYNKVSGKDKSHAGNPLPAEIKGFGEVSVATLANGLTGVEHTDGDAKAIYDSAITDAIKKQAESKALEDTTWVQALAHAKAMK